MPFLASSVVASLLCSIKGSLSIGTSEAAETVVSFRFVLFVNSLMTKRKRHVHDNVNNYPDTAVHHLDLAIWGIHRISSSAFGYPA